MAKRKKWRDLTITDEMQVRNYGAREIGRRSRFYQTTIDFDFLTAGEAYKDLGNAYVIFFCPFPLWGGARRVYTFENTCREDKNLTLQDGMTKVFLSSAGRPTDHIDPDVAAFLDYMNGILGDNPFIKEIDDEIHRLKENGEKEELYMNFLMSINDDLIEARAEARTEGRAEGRAEARESAAVKMLRRLSKHRQPINAQAMADIAEDLDLSPARVQELAHSNGLSQEYCAP